MNQGYIGNSSGARIEPRQLRLSTWLETMVYEKTNNRTPGYCHSQKTSEIKWLNMMRCSEFSQRYSICLAYERGHGFKPQHGEEKKNAGPRVNTPSHYLPYLSDFQEKHQGRRHLTWLLSLHMTLLHLDVSSPLKTLLLTLLNQSPTLSAHKGFESLAPDTPCRTDL